MIQTRPLSLPPRQATRAVPAQPAPSRPSAPRQRDSLSLGTDRNGDGALTLDELQYSRAAVRRFARLDLDEDGRLTTDELRTPKRRACEAPPADATEPKNPPGKPAAEPAEAQTPPETPEAPPEVVPDTPELPGAFGYATQFAHPVWQLASQLGADMDAMLQANGWDDPGASIPAGAVVQVPDTPTSRSLARQYGGAITENTSQSAEAEAPQAPTATATEAAAPASAGKGEIVEAARALQADGYVYPPNLSDQYYHDRFHVGCCADFAADAWTRAGVDVYQEMVDGGYNPHYTPSQVQFFKDGHGHSWHGADEPAEVGDMVFFKWATDGSGDPVSHVAIVTEVGPDGKPSAIIESSQFNMPVRERAVDPDSAASIVGYGRV